MGLFGELIIQLGDLYTFEAYFYFSLNDDPDQGTVDVSLFRHLGRCHDASFEIVYGRLDSFAQVSRDYFFDVIDGQRRIDAIESKLNAMAGRNIAIARAVDIHYSRLVVR